MQDAALRKSATVSSHWVSHDVEQSSSLNTQNKLNFIRKQEKENILTLINLRTLPNANDWSSKAPRIIFLLFGLDNGGSFERSDQ